MYRIICQANTHIVHITPYVYFKYDWRRSKVKKHKVFSTDLRITLNI